MNAKEKIIIEYNKMSDNEKARVIYAYHEEMRKQKGVPMQGHRVAHAHTIKHTAKHFHLSVGRAHFYAKRGEGLCIFQC